VRHKSGRIKILVSDSMIRLGNTGRIAVNGSYGSTTKRLEGLDEILTVTRIGLPKELRRALACTNIVENVMRSASRLPQREAMAISFNDIALDRGGDAGSSQASADCTKQPPALRVTLEAHRTKASTHGVLARQADARVTSTSARIAPQCQQKAGHPRKSL
jgi:putative transposase